MPLFVCTVTETDPQCVYSNDALPQILSIYHWLCGHIAYSRIISGGETWRSSPGLFSAGIANTINSQCKVSTERKYVTFLEMLYWMSSVTNLTLMILKVFDAD